MTYTQLTYEQRYQIYALMKAGLKQVKIAEVIGTHPSTVSRELDRNRGQRGYRPKQAQRFADERRHTSNRRIGEGTWKVVEQLIRQEWSPEQVSARLKRDLRVSVSHEWIYQYILADKEAGGDLYRHLRCQKPRKKRYGIYDRRGKLPDRTSIEERPLIVALRKRLGDWEIDTVLGKGRRHLLVTLTERKSRLTRIYKVVRKTAQEVGDAVIEVLGPMKELVHTITSDNGKEFAHHKRIARELAAEMYFAHPYASWERGTNENTNGLIRQYFPKDMDLSAITEEELQSVEERLNSRPRKCLDFMSPVEVFFGIYSPIALGT